MTKIKTLIVTLLAATLLVFMCAGGAFYALADDGEATEPPAQQQTEDTTEPPKNAVDPDISTDESSLNTLIVQFTEYLKTKYGADYEFYYNNIIEQWGSIEAYLLSFGEKLPEEHRSGWQKFIGWLTEYSPVWAPVFAVILVIFGGVIGKKQLNKLVERLVNSKLSPLVRELNLQSNATAAMLNAQKALLGGNERFVETVAEIDKAEKELKA